MKTDEKITITEDEIIKKVMEEHPTLYDDLNYNEYTIKDKLEKQPYFYQQYRLLLIKEKGHLERIKQLKDKYIGELYEKLKYGDRKLSKTEIERYFIPKDQKAIQFEKLCMRQSIRVETFEAIYKAFEQQGYAMANFIKNMQL